MSKSVYLYIYLGDNRPSFYSPDIPTKQTLSLIKSNKLQVFKFTVTHDPVVISAENVVSRKVKVNINQSVFHIDCHGLEHEVSKIS